GDLLMVKNQGEGWAVPSGGIESGETAEMCCIREVKEETGYDIAIEKPLFVKDQDIEDIHATTYYFEVNVVGGMLTVDDPDESISEVEWKTAEEIEKIAHAYPDDVPYLTNFLHEKTP
ncbi:MAG: NUDIX hydrolase, partial [Anaerobacillus sp.]